MTLRILENFAIGPDDCPITVGGFDDRTYDGFHNRVEPVLREICEGRFVIDYFGIHFELEPDALLCIMRF